MKITDVTVVTGVTVINQSWHWQDHGRLLEVWCVCGVVFCVCMWRVWCVGCVCTFGIVCGVGGGGVCCCVVVVRVRGVW